jgi:hypothetical protein
MMKKFAVILLLMPAALSTLNAQSPLFNAVYWGTYLQDNLHYPTFNFANTDLIDRVVVSDDSPESIYVIGQSFAPPKGTIGACSGTQSVKLGSGDGYLAKYDRCGELKWMTFIGDYCQSIALDVQNGKTIIYVAGDMTIQGANGPVAFKCDGSNSGLFQPTNDDNTEAFIAKFSDDDSVATLLRWTYFGGTNVNSISGAEDILGLAILNHDVWAVGNTTSTDLDEGAQHKGDSTYGSGSGDGFVAQFDSMLSTLKFFSYVGAGGNDRFHDIAVYDPANGSPAVFVSGTTSSSNQIASGTGFDQTYGGANDAFVQKWEDTDENGTYTRSWGTYIGGSGGEHSRFMHADKSGNVYLTGFTQSTNMPVTPLAYDQLFGADGSPSTTGDAYVIKLNSSGENEWCTYFGGKKDETANGLATFRKQGVQYVVISGLTKAASNFFPLLNSLQEKLNGTNNNQYYDAYVAILTDVTATQQQLVQCSYLGGTNAEGVQTGVSYHPSVAMGPGKEIYLVTATMSADINATVGSEFKHLLQPYAGGSDAFIAKLVDSTSSAQTGCAFFEKQLLHETPFQNTVLTVFPNPFDDHTTLLLHAPENATLRVEVMDACQRVVTSQVIQLTQGRNERMLDLSEMPSGIYVVRITAADYRLVKKIIKN